MELSDYAEERPEADQLRAALDKGGGEVLGARGWRDALEPAFLRHVEARRTYDGASVRALLRLLRNQQSHRHDLPAELEVDRTRAGLLAHVSAKFPLLLLRCVEAARAALPADAPAELAEGLAYPRPRRHRSPARTIRVLPAAAESRAGPLR